MSIEAAIKQQQSKLIKLAKTKGLYENFGQKEVRKLESRYIDTSDYSPSMNKIRSSILRFDNWCMDYCG